MMMALDNMVRVEVLFCSDIKLPLVKSSCKLFPLLHQGTSDENLHLHVSYSCK
jgi:hypothetical protein